MLTPTEAIAIAPAFSSAHEIFSAPASSSAPSGFSTQRPPSLQGSPDPSSPTLEPTQHDSHWLPLIIPERLNARLPRKGGYPQTRGKLSLPETSASPTRVSAVVTGMFHTRQKVTIRPRRTIPDSTGFPPRLYSTNMRPCNNTHSSLGKVTCICTAPAHPRTISLYSSSVHNNVS